MTTTSDPPTSCEYETASGAACPHMARYRLVFRDGSAAASLSGEPVRFFGHACEGHLERAKRVPGGIVVDSVEPL